MKDTFNDWMMFICLFLLIPIAYFMGFEDEAERLITGTAGAILMWLKGQVKG